MAVRALLLLVAVVVVGCSEEDPVEALYGEYELTLECRSASCSFRSDMPMGLTTAVIGDCDDVEAEFGGCRGYDGPAIRLSGPPGSHGSWSLAPRHDGSVEVDMSHFGNPPFWGDTLVIVPTEEGFAIDAVWEELDGSPEMIHLEARRL